MNELFTLCPNIPLDETGSVPRTGKQKVARLIGSAQVLLCTLNSSGSHYFQDAVSESRFQTFLLDEGGQCLKVEFFIATTFPGIKRIIVMGDPKQLRPTVLEPACSFAGSPSIQNSPIGHTIQNGSRHSQISQSTFLQQTYQVR